MALIRILLADDHTVVREGTRRILEREPDLKVVAEAGDGDEAIRLAERERPDVAVVDISMPRVGGIEATKGIKRVSPETAVLVLTAYDDDQFVFASLEAGAQGYLLKNARGSELIDAVRRVRNGESVLHPNIVSIVLRRISPDGASRAEPSPGRPTEREMDVLRLAARGLSNRRIAQELVVSPRTVESHMARVFSKLNVGSRTQAVMVALRRGWLTLNDISEP